MHIILDFCTDLDNNGFSLIFVYASQLKADLEEIRTRMSIISNYHKGRNFRGGGFCLLLLFVFLSWQPCKPALAK